MVDKDLQGRWALILGASSGFGEAIARKLSALGMNIAGVHLDRKNTQKHVEELVQDLFSQGSKAQFFNYNAADKEKRRETIDTLKSKGVDRIHCLVHSLAFGSLRAFVPADPTERVTEEQLDITHKVMAHSLVYWVQDLFEQGMLRKGSRIFAMTSSGSSRVWPLYGPVSGAKAALESHCRQLALELAPYGITVNAFRAGVTLTPALRKIPGHERMISLAQARNPSGRLTEPSDVAHAVSLLVREESGWITGNVIGVDGGEEISG